MEFSSDRISDKYLELNICGIQQTYGKEREARRPAGRLDYHILYIIEGSCILTRAGVQQKVAPGNIILFHPHEPQFYKYPAGENVTSLFIHFSGTGCKELLEQCGLFEPVMYIGKSERLKSIFSKLVNEYMLKKHLFSAVCTGLTIQFLAEAGRRVINGDKKIYPEGRIEQICRIMQSNLRENHPVSYYASLCNLSESRFWHLFKEQTGHSPKQYIIKTKVESACSLLEYHGCTIREAAQAVGIEDLNYFSRLIRTHTGYAPGRFRLL